MPTIELTDEQADELRDVLQREIDGVSESISDDLLRLIEPDYIERTRRKSVLSDILELLEVA
jgi:hypothetical protein